MSDSLAAGVMWVALLGLTALAAPEPLRTECHVARVGGVPAFIVNGKPHSGVCYSSYDARDLEMGRRVAQFRQAGCTIFNFVVEIAGYGYSPPMWAGPDQWDFSELDRRAHTVLKNAPDALLLPRIYIDAPQWWRQQNPGEMMVLSNGTTGYGAKLFALSREGDYPSLASEKWLRDMDRALETVVAHVEASDWGGHVVGYQLSGQKTEEWYHWSMNTPVLGDYSPHMARAFRQWLAQRYASDDDLQRAWHRPQVTRAEAEVPSQAARFGDQTRTFRDPAREREVMDFHAFWQDVMADTISHFAGVVKRQVGGRKVVGAFYGYVLEFTELAEDAGHLALRRLLQSPDVDFIMSPSSYYNRNLPGQPYFRLPMASVSLHGKLFWNDFDQVSYKYFDKLKADPNLKTWEYQMGLTRTPEEFVWMIKREVGMELAQGAQLAYFDIHGGYYEDPVIMAGVAEANRLRERALGWKDRGSNAQVLLLVDEASEHTLTFRNPITTRLLSAQVAVMPFVAPYDVALLADVPALDLSRYRLVLVLNASSVPSDLRRELKQKLLRDGRTVVWLHAPGLFRDGESSEENMRDLTGITIRSDGRPREGVKAAGLGLAADCDLPLLPGAAFRVDWDDAATPLAFTTGAPLETVVAMRDMGTWRSVYSACAPLDAKFLRALAIQAGVHMYVDSPRWLVFAGPHCLTVGADKDGGWVTIHLPRRLQVVDILQTHGTWGAGVGTEALQERLRPKEVCVYELREPTGRSAGSGRRRDGGGAASERGR